MTVESVEPGASAATALREPPLAGGGVPLLGHGWKLVRDPLAFMAQLRDHGDVVRIRIGPKTVYAVTTPALTGAVALSPDYIIAGPLWESLEGLERRASPPPTARCTGVSAAPSSPRSGSTRSPAYGPIMAEEAYALVERWRSGEALDVTAESFRVAVRVTARCLMRGSYMDARAERICADLATLFSGMYQRMVEPPDRFIRCRFRRTEEFELVLADLHVLVDEIVADRRASGQKPDDLLTALLEAKDENGEPIGEQEIHDQVIAILTPGSETVGATVMSLLRLLPTPGTR
ncbi:cytochrome P450 [Streptomyces hirsutus]